MYNSMYDSGLRPWTVAEQRQIVKNYLRKQGIEPARQIPGENNPSNENLIAMAVKYGLTPHKPTLDECAREAYNQGISAHWTRPLKQQSVPLFNLP